MAKDSTAQDSVSQLRLDISVSHSPKKNLAPAAQGLRHCRFKPQLNAQLVLLPPNLKPLLPDNHFVFFLIKAIKQLDFAGVLVKYMKKGGIGRSPYDPIMMITLIVYCYSQGSKSTREMERMCENIEKLSIKIETSKEELGRLETVNNPKNAVIARNLQDEIKYCRKRLAKISRSKKRLESRVKARTKVAAKAKKNLKEQGRKIRKIPDPKKALPEPKEQINFTDPDSRIMGHSGGEFEQCYNVQIAVDSQHQIIVAQDVVQNGNDKKLLEPMFLQVHQRLGRYPEAGSADAGYFSEEMVSRKSLSNIELFLPPDRETHPRISKPSIGRIPKNISPADRMRRKLSTTSGKELYAQRKCIVEPVFGQVKHSVFGFDQFSWRGLQNVRNEWALVCAAHNLCKIHRAISRELAQLPSSIAAA